MATIKILELIGVSDKSWHDAVEQALKEASKSMHGITGVEVISTTAKI
jgi:dodecin